MRNLILPLVMASLLSPFGGKAHRKTEEGNGHYELGEYGEALADYTEAQVVAPESARLHYDIGDVLYKQGDYEGAAEAFTRALVTAPDDLAPLAAYNLGNARFRQQEFDSAVDAYRRSLEARPDDPDAKRNLELALRAIEEQQQQQQEDEQQDEGEDEGEGDPNQGEQGGEQDQDQEQDSPSGEGDETPPEGEAEQQETKPQDEGMTQEQAERLLDSLAAAEQKNLEEERQRKAAALRGKQRERDW